MTSTQHTGVVVSAAEADAWHAEIKTIMAERHLNFGDAIDWYIRSRAGKQSAAGYNAGVDQSGWDAA